MSAEDMITSERIAFKDKLSVETKELTADQNKKERLKIKCDVVGCDYNTGFVTHELAQEQYQNHWIVKHEFVMRQMQYEKGKSFRDKKCEYQEEIEEAKRI